MAAARQNSHSSKQEPDEMFQDVLLITMLGDSCRLDAHPIKM
jgi:hypothetical protein